MLVLSKKIMNKCNVIMFAAGLGTRLRPATTVTPKPALPLNQIPLGYFTLPYLEHLQTENFIVNTFHLPKKIHDLYKKVSDKIIFSDEVDFIKGSGGGLKQAEKFFNLAHPILALNADEIFFTENNLFLNAALELHSQKNSLATLIVTEHADAGTKFGAIWCENEIVVHIGKDKPLNNPHAKPWHFIGLQILSSAVLDLINGTSEKNIFYDVLVHELKNKKIQIYPIKCDWFEVGNIDDYKIAKKEINENLKTNSIYKNHFKDLEKYPQSELGDLA